MTAINSASVAFPVGSWGRRATISWQGPDTADEALLKHPVIHTLCIHIPCVILLLKRQSTCGAVAGTSSCWRFTAWLLARCPAISQCMIRPWWVDEAVTVGGCHQILTGFKQLPWCNSRPNTNQQSHTCCHKWVFDHRSEIRRLGTSLQAVDFIS